MKKFIMIIALILVGTFIFGCSNENKSKDDSIEVELNDKDISTITYKLVNGFAGYKEIKIYDLVNNTYFESTKVNGEYLYENINMNLEQDKVNEFKRNIVENGILTLQEEYNPNYMIFDSSYWYITIRLIDGTIYKSKGYDVFPSQSELFDQDFYELTGRNLFGYNIDPID